MPGFVRFWDMSEACGVTGLGRERKALNVRNTTDFATYQIWW
jgi:hypothetical protein